MNDRAVIPPPADAPKCPQCGTPLPTGALAGLCPACLLAQGAAADTVTEGKQPPFNPPPVAELAPLFPQLEILELIGKGGMGAVYKARQKQLDRLVALKILPPGIGDDPAFAERFVREAKALAKLNHPGIVTLYEFGNVGQASRLSQTSEKAPAGRAPQGGPPEKNETGATPVLLFYFLMEFVDGVNLRQLLHAGRISPREALAIVPQICDALQFAHDQGIVHRDIKPENILLDRRGRVKVADFGLAKIVGTDAPLTPSLSPSDGERVAKPGEGTPALTDAGKVMGTPNYMAPEQVSHPADVDHRADIYALGVVFYQMLTGELPGKPLAAPSTKVQIDVRLDEVVLRALEKKPERRYQQVSEVKTCVETIAATPPGSSRREEAHSESGSANQSAAMQEAQSRVKAPAIGLLVAGIVDLAAVFFLLVEFVAILLSYQTFSAGATTHPPGISSRLLFFLPLCVALLAAGVVILFGAFKMQRLKSYGLSVAASILAMITPPGLLVGLPFGIWALIVLNLREIKAAFESASRKPTIESAATAPHFSRTAIVGACCLALTVLAVAGALLAASQSIVLALQTPNLPRPLPHQFLDQGRAIFLVAILSQVFGAICALAGTTLGWIAISQIRRSAGKLYGLGLAVFDGLLFPLLILNALLAFLIFFAVPGVRNLLMDAFQVGLGYYRTGAALAVLASIVAVLLLVDFLVVRRVWRKVNRPLANANSPTAAAPIAVPVHSRSGGWKIAAVIVAAVMLVFAIPAGLIFLYITLPSLSRQGTPVPGKLTQLTSGELAHVYDARLVAAVEQRLTREIARRLREAHISFRSVFVSVSPFLIDAECQFDGLRKEVSQNLFEDVVGGLDIRPTGNALWSVKGKGGLRYVSFTVDTSAEMKPQPDPDERTWGPLIERIVTDAINLDDGSLMAFPSTSSTNINVGLMMLENIRLAELKGVDAYMDGSSGLFVLGMTLAPLPENDWDASNAVQIAYQAILSASATDEPPLVKLDPDKGGARTYAFKTREGGKGIMQITGFADNPRGVKIRYKLVQTTTLSFGPVKDVSATTAREGDIGVHLDSPGRVESSNSVSFAIPEGHCQEVIRRFDAHQALTVEAYNPQRERFGHGLLAWVDNRIDPDTATLKCRASLIPEGENLMVPGLFLNLRLLLEVKHGVTLVPADAILRDAQGTLLVWAIKPDQTVSRRRVQVGTKDGANIEIQSGLSPGELVVVGPANNDLHEGQKIRYKLVQAAAASSGSRKPEDSQRKFVRLVVDKAAMTFEGQPTTWDEVGALLDKVPERKNTVLECAVTSDQITVQQQNEWFGKCIALAISHGFEYASFIGIHPLGSKGTPASVGGPTRATRLPAFGPVIERVVKGSGPKTGLQGLDFESGTLLTTTELEHSSDDVVKRWVAERGIDLMAANKSGTNWQLGALQTKFAPVPEERWESASTDELRRALDEARMEEEDGWRLQTLRSGGGKPLTFAFQTGSETIGLLQITGFTDNPPGVKLRYKLVQPQQRQAADSASSQGPPQFTFDPAVELILPLGTSDKHFVNLGSGDSVTNRPMVEIRPDVGGGLIMAFHNRHAFPIEREGGGHFWESTSADELMDRYRHQGFALLPFERNFVFPIQEKDLPMTIELPGAGILQVLEILDGNSPAVKLRYKLVQRNVGKSSAY